MRSVLASTSHAAALPDQALNRSIENRSRCTSVPLRHQTGPWIRQGPVTIGSKKQVVRGLHLRPCGERHRIGRADVDRVRPGEYPLGPGLLRLEDRDELRIVLRLVGDDLVPGLELRIAY